MAYKYGQADLTSGTVVKRVGDNQVPEYYGADGRRYDTYAAAQKASEAYNLSLETAKKSLGYSSSSSKTSGTAATSALTQEFLTKWGSINDTTLAALQKVISGETTDTAYDSLISDIKGKVTEFDTTYGSMTKEAMEGAMSDIKTKRGLTESLVGMATPDYAGVSGKAATDTAAQSALARGEMAREAMSYGIDPTSGKFGALTKKSYMDEARDKVTAMNRARSEEKTRAAGLTATAAGLINPSESADIATNLMTQKSNLLGLQTDTYKAKTAADTAKAGTITTAASAMGDIGEQYGSLGATMLGYDRASGLDENTGVSLLNTLNSGTVQSGYNTVSSSLAAQNAAKEKAAANTTKKGTTTTKKGTTEEISPGVYVNY